MELRDLLLSEVKAASFPQTILRYRNDDAAKEVGLEGLSDDAWADHFARFHPLPDNLPAPMAMAYHGHQFHHYNPDIGDGRGFLFAQLEDHQGRLMDLGTKGSGQTPFSRSGDGRLTLKGAVREILATEMLEAQGVPTSRTLSVFETGEELIRQDEPSPARSAVLVRLNHSHMRFGTFQRLYAIGDEEGLKRALAYSIRQFYPALAPDDAPGFLAAVAGRMATMTARIMVAGFVHGVLNTDNMNITGENFDYGPWRFVDVANPSFTAAYFDHHGLYAYGRQPEAIFWNLHALAQALSPLAEDDALEEAAKTFASAYGEAFPKAALRRLGLGATDPQQDQKLAQDFFTFLREEKLPFERVIFDLHGGARAVNQWARSPLCHHYEKSPVAAAIGARAPSGPEVRRHPIFRSEPPTLLIDEVEEIWARIADADDWSSFKRKIAAIRTYKEALAPAMGS